MARGGSFISKADFQEHLPSLLSFYASCVTLDKKVKYTKFDSPVYTIVPTIITNIANKSRRDSGYRLLTRCVRHSTDAKYYPTKLSDIKIIKCNLNGSPVLALDWCCQVPASMKNVTYDTRLCITTDGQLVSCHCNCKIGSCEESDAHQEKT